MTYISIYYHGTYEEVGVHVFIDFNWVGDINGRWLTDGYVFKLFGGVISWMSRKQSVVSLSTRKDKYIATTHASEEAVWMQQLYIDVGFG